MKIYELLNFNREILKRLFDAGIKTADYMSVDIYNEYFTQKSNGEKVSYIVACLSEKYRLSERQIYAIIDRMSRDI